MHGLAWLVGRVPWRWLAGLGASIGWLAGSILRIRRKHVEASMRRAGVPRAAAEARAMYRQLGRALVELLWTLTKSPAELAVHVVIAPDELERLRNVLAEGRGAILATSHVGNWDVAACAAADQLAGEGRKLALITKRLSWGGLDRLWQHARARWGIRLLGEKGTMREAARILGEGDCVAMMVDQAPAPRAGLARHAFLGEQAFSSDEVAVLSRRNRAPIVMVWSEREGDRHRLRVGEVLTPPQDREQVRAVTLSIQRKTEAQILRRPAQWLWLHRRWKLVQSRTATPVRPC